MRILLVDDEREVLDDLVTALKPTGYEFFKETNPVEAIKSYVNERYDVVISDVRMPEMSGIDLLKRIRELDKNARVIIITAFGDLQTAKDSVNNHAYAFFGKPVEIKDLIQVLGEIEDELKGNRRPDMEKLSREYEHLKKAYDNLIGLLRERRQI